MSEDQKKDKEIDFTSSSSFQRTHKKTKKKQILLYSLISIIVTIVIIFGIHITSQYFIHQKIEDNKFPESMGGNISVASTSYSYNLFSATSETIYYKKIGNRTIVWDTVTKKYPAIGKVQVIERGSGMSQINSMDPVENRVIRYNQYNDERLIDFYYPDADYEIIPEELDIAVELEKNKLIEVALSFEEPIKLGELEEKLGYENVDWLWLNTTTESDKEQFNHKGKLSGFDTLPGEHAFGVNPVKPYSNIEYTRIVDYYKNFTDYGARVQNAVKGLKESVESYNGEITISGAVISGTPEELIRFQGLEFIRASVIGATIDRY